MTMDAAAAAPAIHVHAAGTIRGAKAGVVTRGDARRAMVAPALVSALAAAITRSLKDDGGAMLSHASGSVDTTPIIAARSARQSLHVAMCASTIARSSGLSA